MAAYTGVVTFLDFVYAWSFQISGKKGSFQHYVRKQNVRDI